MNDEEKTMLLNQIDQALDAVEAGMKKLKLELYVMLLLVFGLLGVLALATW